jgi:hypothetical protein
MTDPQPVPIQGALVVRRGATWSAYWPVYDPDGSGNPLDLSGWTAAGQIRAWYGSTEVLFEWLVDNIECTSDGRVVIHVEPDDSDAWEFSEAVYGIELVDPDENRIPLAQGPLIVSPQVVV